MQMKIEEIIAQVFQQAKLIGVCPRFTGQEKTLEDIIRLFTSPQGIEYCIEHHFPNIATLRLFKGFGAEKYGIYIDAGVITLKNPKCAVLIGRTSATVNVDSLDEHNITFMHGAKGTVNASGWAVVRVTEGRGCNVIRNVFNNAVIL